MLSADGPSLGTHGFSCTSQEAKQRFTVTASKNPSNPDDVSRIRSSLNLGSTELPKPNYQFERRQKELAQKNKQEQKRLRKQAENAFITPAVRVDKDAEATKG